jgi:hypothetical protein
MVRRSLGTFAFAAALLVQSTHVAAQHGAAGSSASDVTEIEVLGQREMARRVFKDELRQMTERLSIFEVMPRFSQPLCIEVAGLDPAQARVVADRIRATSFEVGLGEARAGCRTNAVVIVVSDPKRMFKTLLSKRLDLVGVLPFRDVHSRTIKNELREKRPVVWWSVLIPVNAEGATFNDLGLVVTQNTAASRTVSATSRPKTLSVVMYDADQLGGATLQQIADHAALHILGMPRRQTDFGRVALPTMLSLFAGGPDLAPQELTDFDRAYLQAIYRLGPGAFQSQVPRAVVAAYADRCEAEQSDCRIQLRK